MGRRLRFACSAICRRVGIASSSRQTTDVALNSSSKYASFISLFCPLLRAEEAPPVGERDRSPEIRYKMAASWYSVGWKSSCILVCMVDRVSDACADADACADTCVR